MAQAVLARETEIVAAKARTDREVGLAEPGFQQFRRYRMRSGCPEGTGDSQYAGWLGAVRRLANETSLLDLDQAALEELDLKLLSKAKVLRTVLRRYVLPSNRHAFGVHFDLLRRFTTLTRSGTEGVPAAAVEGEGIPLQAGSMNVRFLRSIGLLLPTERGKYVPTPEAMRFINARSVSDAKARPILRALLSSSWFAEVAKNVLGAVPGMSEEQFLGELALVAQTDKSKEEPALRVIVEFLVYSGIVTRDERGLVLTEGGLPGESNTLGSAEGSSVRSSTGLPEPRTIGIDRPTPESGGWHVLQTEDFYLKIRSDLDAVQDLTDHIETLKRKIKRLNERENVSAS